MKPAALVARLRLDIVGLDQLESSSHAVAKRFAENSQVFFVSRVFDFMCKR